MTIDDHSLEALIAVGRLRSRAAILLSADNSTININHVQKLLYDANAADSALLKKWDAQVLADTQFRSMPLCQTDQAGTSRLRGVYPESAEDYHDAYLTMYWNRWRAARVQILNVIVQCATNPEDCQEMHGRSMYYTSASAVTSIRWLVDGMCSSLANIFEKLEKSIKQGQMFPYVADATGTCFWHGIAGKIWRGLALEPLREILDVECIPDGQRQWMTASVNAAPASST